MKLIALIFLLAYFTPIHCSYKVCVNLKNKAVASKPTPCSISLSGLDEILQLQLSIVNTEILINSTATVLSKTLSFDGMVNLTIEGVLGPGMRAPTITCQSNDSGFYFRRIQGLTVRNLAFIGCGALQNSTTTDVLSDGKNQTAKFKSSVYIWMCTNVKILNVHIHRSNGLGMVIFDTNGTVIVNGSTFKWNQMLTSENDSLTHIGGGGIYIEFTACPPGVLYGTCDFSHNYKSDSQYKILDCTFESNRASTLNPENSSFVKLVGGKKLTNLQGLGRGGGLAVRLLGGASRNRISLVGCKFYHNQTIAGGGLKIKIADQANDNSVEILGCKFINNTGDHSGGGINIALRLASIQNNAVQFKHCLIEQNSAKTGGGMLLLLNNLGNCSSGHNSVEFIDSLWISNSAEYGAAIDGVVYAPSGFGDSSIIFKSCNFTNNRVIETQTDVILGIQKSNGRGTFKVSNMEVTFCHSVHFQNNTGTALWVVASKLHFSCTMTGTFLHNFGTNGGAISLISNSILFVYDNTALKFVENRASSKGGALFSHSVHENSFLMSASTCSVQYKGDVPMESRNVSFVFERNVATLDSRSDANNGNSIYLTSLHSCVFFCTLNTSAELTVDNFFSCIGKYHLANCQSCDKDIEVTTQGHKFNVTIDDRTSTTLHATPGRVLGLPVMVLDDLNNTVDSVYRAQVINSGDIAIDPAYDYISNGKIKLYGPPQANGTLLIELAGLHEISLTVSFMLLQCSPGFYVEHKQVQTSAKQMTVQYCTCNWNHSSTSAYKGIICNQEASTAYILHGFWAGYIEFTVTPQYFVTAYCPLHFCSYNDSDFKPFYALPEEATLHMVDQYMCGPARTGILCSKCTSGHSVFYHSRRFECKPNRLCKIGWLFYVLSELCPLTLMFIAIIVFNISFTSGAVNGFIFFAQVLDSLALNAYDISEVYSPQIATPLTDLYEFIYRIFNLDFFNINSLSFCLWQGARTLDMLAFKLVSILYGILLISVTIFLIKKCDYHRRLLKKSKMESYVIHGLAAFLVSCYVQCAQISFRILNPIYLEGVGSYYWNLKLVQYSGNVKYFSWEHLPYALPALLVICTIIALPPLSLIWYPAGRKLLSKCRLNEMKGVQFVEKIFMIDRMKPLLDSFQSSFKDNCRFFAGLYFLYRVLALATFTLARTLPQFYIAVEIELVIIIAFHAAVQPYQKRWHNIVDAFIFSDLAIINALSIYIYIKATDLNQAAEESISIAIIVRLLLIYLPLLYAATYLIMLAIQQLRIRYKFKRRWLVRSREGSFTDSELPARLLHPDEYVPYDKCQQLKEL